MFRICTHSWPSLLGRLPRLCASLLCWLVLPACTLIASGLPGCHRPSRVPAHDATPAIDSGPRPVPRFDDVTASHVTGAQSSLSMDAAIIDVDGDGDLDLIIASEHAPNVLLINDGTGRFSNQSDRIPQVAHDSEDIGIADFDRDGDVDILVVSEDDRVHELYFHDRDGRFTDEGARVPVQSVTNGVAVADIDGDGAPDIVLANNGQELILINDGSGGFNDDTASRLPVARDVTQDVALGDLDGDGDLDMVLANEGDNRLLINDGSGRFEDAERARLPLRDSPEETRDVELGDVDGDGDLDLFFGNVRFFVDGAALENRLLINDGAGRFTDQTADRLPQHPDSTVDGDFVDVDDDGDLDLVTGNTDGLNRVAPFRVLVNDGTGRFRDDTAAFFPDSAVGRCFDVQAADFDGDGRVDFFFANRGDRDRLLLHARP
jgi:hypothetical protein